MNKYSFKIISSTDYGQKEWDSFCSIIFPGHPEYRFEYLNAIWPGWHLLLDQNSLQPIMPLFFRKWDVFLLFPTMPLFLQKLPLNPNSDQQLILLYLKKRFLHFHLSITLNTNAKDYAAQRINLILNLSPSPNHIWIGFSNNLKRNLKKASGYDLKFEQHQKMDSFIQNYKNSVTQSQWALNAKAEESLNRIASLRNTFWLAEVRNKHEVLASAVFLSSDQRIVYLLGCTSSKGRESQAMAWLFWSLIQEESSQGKILDFEGGNLPGLFRFFSSFGAIEEYFYSIHYSRRLF